MVYGLSWTEKLNSKLEKKMLKAMSNSANFISRPSGFVQSGFVQNALTFSRNII